LANSKQPVRRSIAPVNAPFSWPKISLSIKVSGMAAQLIGMKGLVRRGLRSWIVRATNSLPVPLAPVIKTEAVLGATCSIRRKMACICGEAPTNTPRAPLSRKRRRSDSFSVRVLRISPILVRMERSRRKSMGFSM